MGTVGKVLYTTIGHKKYSSYFIMRFCIEVYWPVISYVRLPVRKCVLNHRIDPNQIWRDGSLPEYPTDLISFQNMLIPSPCLISDTTGSVAPSLTVSILAFDFLFFLPLGHFLHTRCKNALYTSVPWCVQIFIVIKGVAVLCQIEFWILCKLDSHVIFRIYCIFSGILNLIHPSTPIISFIINCPFLLHGILF